MLWGNKPKTISIIVDEFDNNTSKEWEAYCSRHASDEKMEDLKNYLRKRCEFFDKLETHKVRNADNKFNSKRVDSKSKVHNEPHSGIHNTASNPENVLNSQCFYCKGDQTICQDFIKFTKSMRIEVAEEHHLRLTCLRPYHNIKNLRNVGSVGRHTILFSIFIPNRFEEFSLQVRVNEKLLKSPSPLEFRMKMIPKYLKMKQVRIGYTKQFQTQRQLRILFYLRPWYSWKTQKYYNINSKHFWIVVRGATLLPKVYAKN
ncbi:hypothetical protein JTB14_000539 [Gonioctena quinquepunctata]|nr:hypothetical protein JTB14_000539 [Gonioctena quinquepunctata]